MIMGTPKEATQTAQQINAEKLGTVDLPSKKITVDKFGNTVLQYTPPDPQAGWWSMRDFKGGLDGVCAKVDADPKVPDFWKPPIKEALRLLCEQNKANFAYLDAHCFIAGKKANVTLTFEVETVL
jgi:prepilin-type processing-associated H-X9-DG protein